MPDNDAPVDRLYQLPLAEFTPARNALAKELKRPTIKDLEKPSIAAWAVNQLYWRERAVYDRVITSAERLRGEHRKLLSGKPSDIRDAETAHRQAVRGASDRIKQILQESGHPASDATLSAVQETLEALPSADTPGRLTRPLKPLGFEALSGVDIKPQPAGTKAPAAGARPQTSGARPQGGLTLVPSAGEKKREREQARQREKEERERKERQRQAEKDLKAAEAAMLRAEEAVKQAEKALGELRAARDAAVSEYQRARLRARQ